MWKYQLWGVFLCCKVTVLAWREQSSLINPWRSFPTCYRTNAIDVYEIVQYIDQGRHSFVFEAVNTSSSVPVVVKVLKSRSMRRVFKEIDVLEKLRNSPNVIRLIGSAAPFSHTKYLLFESIGRNCQPLRHCSGHPLSDPEIKMYIRLLLMALHAIHSLGIIHRDIKPGNIIINRASGALRLLDFGLSDYHVAGAYHSLKVGSRHYKSPELLLGCTDYDFRTDIWSVGCIFAGLIFRDDPFFSGGSEDNDVSSISSVLGSAVLLQLASKSGLELSQAAKLAIGHRPPTPLYEFFSADLLPANYIDAVDLLAKMLTADPKARWNAFDCLAHPYFNS